MAVTFQPQYRLSTVALVNPWSAEFSNDLGGGTGSVPAQLPNPWSAEFPTDYGGGSATSTAWTNFGSPITNTTVTVTGLTTLTSYNFQIVANTEVGTSVSGIITSSTT